MDVKTLCLGVLTLGEASGYEIKKHFEEGPFSHFHEAGFGSIYPALNALSAAGLVTCTERRQAGRPGKKVYAITSQGMAAFKKALDREPSRDKVRSESLFILFFGHLLSEERRRQVYDRYLEDFRRHLDCLCGVEGCEMTPSRRFVHGFGLAMYRAVADYMENNRHLLVEKAPEELKTGTD